MCGGILPLDDKQIAAAQRLVREKREPLLTLARSALQLPPDDPVDILSNALAEGTGVMAINALRAATLLHLNVAPQDAQLPPHTMLERISRNDLNPPA